MALSEKRGSVLQKCLDQNVGPVLLGVLGALLWVKNLLPSASQEKEVPLLICFGAIGDLIVLTTAAKQRYPAGTVYLACSKLNLPCAKLYEDFYAGIEVVDLKSFRSILGICRRFRINKIYDSTQWANIGPVQVGLARLATRNLKATGFKTMSLIRSSVYDIVIPHGRNIHEVGNFANMLAEKEIISTNADLANYFPSLYQPKPLNRTGKVLFHMWPSGNRSYLKAWPEAYWIALVQNLIGRGYEIYLSGSPADKEKTEEFVRKVGEDKVINLSGVYGLAELGEFIKNQIEFAISVNTGILHLVASCGVPLIGLHGGVNPVRWGPLGNKAISLLPESGRSAYLHYGFEYPDDDREAYVLDRLSVSQVINAVDALTANR